MFFKKKLISLIIIIVSFILILTGVFFGDLTEGILEKAINLCYECIGIG